MQCVRNCGVVVMVLWDCSSKKGEFHRAILLRLALIGFSRVSRISRVRVSVRFRVTLV